jgi:hypothetical protein
MKKKKLQVGKAKMQKREAAIEEKNALMWGGRKLRN